MPLSGSGLEWEALHFRGLFEEILLVLVPRFVAFI